MKSANKMIIKILITLFVALSIGAILILLIGENPIKAYSALLKGAFGTKLGFGNTISGWTPLLLTSVAFCVAALGGAFNVGVEGEVILGGLVSAYIGINWGFLPVPLLYIACFLGSMIVSAIWALIPALLKVNYNVSEICVTILMNSVAVYIGSYFVSGPMSAGTANPQSKPVLVNISKIILPSSANYGIFIAIGIVALIIFILYKTKQGFEIKMIGLNKRNAEYIGVNSKWTFIKAMLISGMLGGIAGCIEVLGVHGYYLDGFATGLGANGMLAALIVKANPVFAPITAFFLAVLKSGSMAMQQSTNVPKSIVDTISAIFIIIATMDIVIEIFNKNEQKDKSIGVEKNSTVDVGENVIEESTKLKEYDISEEVK